MLVEIRGEMRQRSSSKSHNGLHRGARIALNVLYWLLSGLKNFEIKATHTCSLPGRKHEH